MRLCQKKKNQKKEKPEQLLEEVTFEGIGKYIKEGQCEYTDMYFVN